ncbi:MAG: UTP--glucose-1-phosphate uridylyltransferase [Nitriliruptoraceae bacterium]
MIRKAVLPVAGLGTRALPATKVVPKELLPVVDKPAIQYMVEECARAGLDDVLFVNSAGKHLIEDHFDRLADLEAALDAKGKVEELEMVRELASLATIHSVRQPEPLGLGHAILMAASHVGDEGFAVLLGDDIVDPSAPFLERMIDIHDQTGRAVLALMEVPDEQTSLYGIATVEPTDTPGVFDIVDLVEKPPPGTAPSNLAVIGRYVLPGSIFPELERTQPGRGGEIQVTDALRAMAHREPIVGVLLDVPRHDVGDKLGFLQATVELAAQRPEFGAEFVAWLRDWVAEQPR